MRAKHCIMEKIVCDVPIADLMERVYVVLFIYLKFK